MCHAMPKSKNSKNRGKNCATKAKINECSSQSHGARKIKISLFLLLYVKPCHIQLPLPGFDISHANTMLLLFVLFVFLTSTDRLRIQPWSQDRWNQTKSNRESEISRESRHKRTNKKVASKGHRRDEIENTNKNTQTLETN